MWAKVTSAFRRGDGDPSSVQPHQHQQDPGNPRPSHDEVRPSFFLSIMAM